MEPLTVTAPQQVPAIPSALSTIPPIMDRLERQADRLQAALNRYEGSQQPPASTAGPTPDRPRQSSYHGQIEDMRQDLCILVDRIESQVDALSQII